MSWQRAALIVATMMAAVFIAPTSFAEELSPDQRLQLYQSQKKDPVSYTHLTLPTILRV